MDASQVSFLGKYRIEKKLGEGGMGCVFLATDAILDRKVAIKTINFKHDISIPDVEQNVKDRFLREARALAQLRHQNVVSIYDISVNMNIIYFVMEYVEGSTLADLIEQGYKFSDEEAESIIKQISNGLLAVHEKGYIHRDIKPSNILLTNDKIAKIADFGIVRQNDSNLTKGSGFVGTINYLSPEQLRGEKIDIRSDIFSLGALMYELMIGQPAFSGENMANIMYRIINDNPQHSLQSNICKNKHIIESIKICLDKDPNKRFQNIKQFLDFINQPLHDNASFESRDIGIFDERNKFLMHRIKSSPFSFSRNSFMLGMLTLGVSQFIISHKWFSDHSRTIRNETRNSTLTSLLTSSVLYILGLFAAVVFCYYLLTLEDYLATGTGIKLQGDHLKYIKLIYSSGALLLILGGAGVMYFLWKESSKVIRYNESNDSSYYQGATSTLSGEKFIGESFGYVFELFFDALVVSILIYQCIIVALDKGAELKFFDVDAYIIALACIFLPTALVNMLTMRIHKVILFSLMGWKMNRSYYIRYALNYVIYFLWVIALILYIKFPEVIMTFN